VNSAVKTALKKVTSAIAASEAETVKSTLKEAISVLDRAASKGVIPKGRVSRKISRLTVDANRVILPAPDASA